MVFSVGSPKTSFDDAITLPDLFIINICSEPDKNTVLCSNSLIDLISEFPSKAKI